MKDFKFSEEKDRVLRESRDFGFKDIIKEIKDGKIVKTIKNPNQKLYPNQKMYLVEFREHIAVVPFVEQTNYNFLKTVFISKKYTKKYLKVNKK